MCTSYKVSDRGSTEGSITKDLSTGLRRVYLVDVLVSVKILPLELIDHTRKSLRETISEGAPKSMLQYNMKICYHTVPKEIKSCVYVHEIVYLCLNNNHAFQPSIVSAKGKNVDR